MASDQEIHDRIHFQFKQFLTGHVEGIRYLEEAVKNESSRVIIPVDRLTAVNDKFFASIVVDPFTFIPPCELALQSVYPTDLFKNKDGAAAHLGFTGWLESHRMVTPRALCASLLHQIVAVEGIVTKCSLVRPKAVESVLYCAVAEEGKKVTSRLHNDMSGVRRDKFAVHVLPQQNEEGLHYDLEVGLSRYKDYQRFTIQEMPECAPTGQLPRSIDTVVEGDLVDAVKPGDRVRVYGVFKAVPVREGSKVTGHSRAFIVGNNIEKLRCESNAPKFTPQEIRQIEEIASRRDTFDIVSRSVSPAICGNSLAKKGLLLQLLGGVAKQCPNGMKLRGDIHALLIGDPSCGKSQMLRFIMNVAPLALSTTGRGSSGVGLTAAVTMDNESKERRLEAGAMVLADGGIVCIDEFDKMSDEDRVAIHEVMEQQTVTISKAGIQTSLNARCSVVAAANPIYGTFDEDKDIRSQVNFPDSLLSRFDLVFIVRDPQTAEEDRNICRQVLRQLQLKSNTTKSSSTAMFGRSDELGGGGGVSGNVGISTYLLSHNDKDTHSIWQNELQGDGHPTLTLPFLKKYLYYCKHSEDSPTLSDDARQEIAEFYADIRQRVLRSNEHNNKILAVPTPRSLEACIRLATAHAKLKLRKLVISDDVKRAKQLLLWTMCGEKPESSDEESEGEKDGLKKKKGQRKQKGRGGRKALESPAIGNSPNIGKKKKRGRRTLNGAEHDDKDASQSALTKTLSELTISEQQNSKRVRTGEKPSEHAITQKRLEQFIKAVATARTTIFRETENIDLTDLKEEVNKQLEDEFSPDEFKAGLTKLAEDNKAMVVNDSVWFI